jgi:hypothetical protein
MGAKGPVEPDSLANSTQREALPKPEGSCNRDLRRPNSETVYRAPRRKSCTAAARLGVARSSSKGVASLPARYMKTAFCVDTRWS